MSSFKIISSENYEDVLSLFTCIQCSQENHENNFIFTILRGLCIYTDVLKCHHHDMPRNGSWVFEILTGWALNRPSSLRNEIILLCWETFLYYFEFFLLSIAFIFSFWKLNYINVKYSILLFNVS